MNPSIQFETPDDKARKRGIAAQFSLGVHVETFGGRLCIKGHVVRVDGRISSWTQAEICGSDSINAANSWILARFLEWERGGR